MCRLATAVIPVFLGATALSLTACGGPQFAANGRPLPTPEEPGLYVLTTADELHRIDGSPEWERKTWPTRANYDPGSEFIVYEPAMAGGTRPLEDAVNLWRIAWLRSELEPTGLAAPPTGSQWVFAELDGLSVPLLATPHPEIPGVAHFGPTGRLDPGLYELRVRSASGGARAGRIGIAWNSTNKRSYSAAHCVDRIVGQEGRYRPCASAIGTFAAAAPGSPPVSASTMNSVRRDTDALRIELQKPRRESGGLRISGTVINTSNSMQAVPMLKGTIFDGSGTPADSWLFSAPDSSVTPGGQVAFQTWRPAPPGAARLDVDFVQN